MKSKFIITFLISLFLSKTLAAQNLLFSNSFLNKLEVGDYETLYDESTDVFRNKYSKDDFQKLARKIDGAILTTGLKRHDLFKSSKHSGKNSRTFSNGVTVITVVYSFFPDYLFNSYTDNAASTLGDKETKLYGVKISTINQKNLDSLNGVELIYKGDFLLSTYQHKISALKKDTTNMQIGFWFNEGNERVQPIPSSKPIYMKYISEITNLLNRGKVKQLEIKSLDISSSLPYLGISFINKAPNKKNNTQNELVKSLLNRVTEINTDALTEFELILNYSKAHKNQFYMFSDSTYGIFKSKKIRRIQKSLRKDFLMGNAAGSR